MEIQHIIRIIQCKWLVLVASFFLVLVLGVIDYITGDYSILVFYMLPVAYASWYAGKGGGLSIAFLSGIARFVSDMSAYSNPKLHFWNSIQDTVFLMIAGLLVSALKNVMDREKHAASRRRNDG